jgi:predicted ester cyclase
MVPENEAIVRRFLGQLWNDGVLGVADELVAAEHVHHLGGQELIGPEGVTGAVSWLRGAFPDLHFEIDDLVSTDDRVVVRWTATGTHEGAFDEVAPTGRRVTWIGCDWFRIRTGKLTEAYVVTDGGALRDQLTSP